jgi:two-component system sensor histidine kinase/response regulator
MELLSSPPAPASLLAPGRKSARPLRVLLAEDNAVNQHLARALLEKEGHAVTLARDGNEAVRLALDGGFDAVLMDVQMPGLDGFEATAAIRRHEKRTSGHLPIIGVTAHAMKGDRERCLAAGMDHYVAKPLRAELLMKALASAVPAPTAPSAGPPVFDERAALELLSQDHALLLELAQLFLLDSPRRMIEIRAALERKDWKTLRLEAHSLKASAEVLSGRRTGNAAMQVEQAAARMDLAAAQAAVELLTPELLQLQAVLGALASRRA